MGVCVRRNIDIVLLLLLLLLSPSFYPHSEFVQTRIGIQLTKSYPNLKYPSVLVLVLQEKYLNPC